MNFLGNQLLLSIYILAIVFSYIDIIAAGKKVVVNKTVKKTIRRVPVDDPDAKDSITKQEWVKEYDDEEGGSKTVKKKKTGKGGRQGGLNTEIIDETTINVDEEGNDGNGGKRRRKGKGGRQGESSNTEIIDETTINVDEEGTDGNGGKQRRKGNGGQGGKRRRKGGPRTKLVADIEITEESRSLRSQWNGGRSLTKSDGCDATTGGWHQRSGFQYKVIVAVMNHDQAEDACKRECAHLVSIHSREENDFVGDLVSKAGLIGTPFGWWLGMRRSPKSFGNFNEFSTSWHDDTRVNFGLVHGRTFQGGQYEAPWSPGQPDYSIHLGGEDCVHMWPADHVWARMWNDITCTTPLNGGVCMKPASGVDDDTYDDADYAE